MLDINADEEIHTALISAVVENHEDVVKLLFKNGADANTESKFNGTLLHDATKYANTNNNISNLLIIHGANVNAVN